MATPHRNARHGMRGNAKHVRALERVLDGRGEPLLFAVPVTLLILDRDGKTPSVYPEAIVGVSTEKIHYFRAGWGDAQHLSAPRAAMTEVAQRNLELVGVSTAGGQPVANVVSLTSGPRWVLVGTPESRALFLEQCAKLGLPTEATKSTDSSSAVV